MTGNPEPGVPMLGPLPLSRPLWDPETAVQLDHYKAGYITGFQAGLKTGYAARVFETSQQVPHHNQYYDYASDRWYYYP